MSGPLGAAAPPGRNDPCPCGSGRKYKLCCGAAGSHRPGEAVPSILRAATPIVPPGGTARKVLDLGPLSEAGRIREEAQRRLRSLYPDPLAALRLPSDSPGAERGPTPQRQVEMAERHRQRAARLLEAGQAAAAMAALRQATDLDADNAELRHTIGRAYLHVGQLDEAEASFKLAILLKDDFAAAHLEFGIAVERQGRPHDAIAAFRRAVELEPALADAHRRLARLLESIGDIEGAVESLRCAAAAAPETAEGWRDEGWAWALEGDCRRAEEPLRQSIAADPTSAPTHKLLGDVLATEGRFDEAIAAYDRALEAEPLQVDAHLGAVQARKCGEADRPRLTRMLSTLRAPKITDGHRMLLHFAVGKLLDDLGEYREAMGHFDAANSLRNRRKPKFDHAGFASAIDRSIGRFAATFFAENAAYGRDDETPILIVGLPRSGTTLVEQILASHPQIAAGGEQPFWVNRASAPGIVEATSLTPKMGHELSADYLSLLRRIGKSAPRVTDKLPFNYLRLGLIHLLLPRARIIHCRRHPIDTCLSMYFIYFKVMMDFVADKGDLVFAYRNYTRLMDHWRTVLPPDRFMEVDYENLVADREVVTRRLVAFSGLEWNDSCLEPERQERAILTASFWQARQPVYATSVERC
jgi:tetratricopeptide (TPR) repeat protein